MEFDNTFRSSGLGFITKCILLISSIFMATNKWIHVPLLYRYINKMRKYPERIHLCMFQQRPISSSAFDFPYMHADGEEEEC